MAGCREKEPISVAAELVHLRIADAELAVEIADTTSERARGLMYRTELAPDGGMLFVYQAAIIPTYIMENTTIPLSIAFIDAGGAILDIQDMGSESPDEYTSPGPVLYALEVNQGWFRKKGIRVGDKVEGL